MKPLQPSIPLQQLNKLGHRLLHVQHNFPYARDDEYVQREIEDQLLMSETLPFPVELYNELSNIIQRDIFFQIYTLTFPPLPRPDILRDKFYPVFKKIKTKLIFTSSSWESAKI